MAGPFVCNLFCEVFDAGWTETYYPLGTDYASILTAMDGLVTARAAISCIDVRFINLRVSDLTIRGDAINRTPTTGNGLYTTTAVTADPNIALLCREIGAGFLRRALRYLRGLPEAVFQFHPLQYNPPGAPWPGALATYLGQLVNLTQLVHRAPGPVFTTTAISSVIAERATVRRAGRPFGRPPGRRVRA